LDHALGNVLIAGLGLGLILPAILAKPEVEKVTVIEKEMDVIQLVRPSLFKVQGSSKLLIIHDDIFTWRPPRYRRLNFFEDVRQEFDTIYFDIWPDYGLDNLPEIARLHQAFKSYKAPGGWMSSWLVDYLRNERRKENKQRQVGLWS
jgi:spermidine synthase